MFVKRFRMMFLVTISGLLIIAACTPTTGNNANTANPSITTNQTQSENQEKAATAITSETMENNNIDGASIIVEVTPISDEDLAVQPEDQSEPGASAESEGTSANRMAQNTYADDIYRFSVNYPIDFVFRTRSTETLMQFKPQPTASFLFMDPVIADSDLGDLEPADLEILVYELNATASLESWLTTNGFLPTDGSISPQPLQTANISGIKVCASTMIAPGCSYFVINDSFLYQLTPATLEGETMIIDTFMLLP